MMRSAVLLSALVAIAASAPVITTMDAPNAILYNAKRQIKPNSINVDFSSDDVISK